MPRHNNGADRLTHSARVGDAAGSRADTYARVTAAIIAAIEHGAGEWHAPWFHNGSCAARPTNVASGRRYRGIR